MTGDGGRRFAHPVDALVGETRQDLFQIARRPRGAEVSHQLHVRALRVGPFCCDAREHRREHADTAGGRQEQSSIERHHRPPTPIIILRASRTWSAESPSLCAARTVSSRSTPYELRFAASHNPATFSRSHATLTARSNTAASPDAASAGDNRAIAGPISRSSTQRNPRDPRSGVNRRVISLKLADTK